MKRAFGTPDPLQDARRVRTAAMMTDAFNQSNPPGGAGALENKIYLWPGDGGQISAFDADQAGLIAALAAAASGDTVWLPSIPIALTTAITISADVALCGISHKAILSFSGFSTEAIILSAGSIIQDFTLNHSDGKWFQAAADGSQALRIHGSARRAIVGINVAPVVAEIWAGEAAGIFWRTVAGTWNAVASLPSADPIRWFNITNDGATAYVTTQAIGGGDITHEKLYKCHNPKEASPTWTLIAQNGTAAAGSTIATYFNYTIGPCVISGTRLYTVAHLDAAASAWAYGIYDGIAWAWSRTTDYTTSSPTGAGRDMYGFAQSGQYIRDGANALLDSYADANVTGYEFYYSLSGNRYCSRRVSGSLYLYQIGGSDLATLGTSSADAQTIATHISGAENGDQVYVVSAASGADGHLWLSDDGSSFSDIATWAQGWARDDVWAGGGKLIWLPATVLSGATMLRRYLRAGTVDVDLTSNFWSVTTGDKTFRGLGLVYA